MVAVADLDAERYSGERSARADVRVATRTPAYSRWIVVALSFQVFALALFVTELLGTIFDLPAFRFSWEIHEFIELASILALVTGSAITLMLLRVSLRRTARVEEQLGLASESFHAVVTTKFDDWALSAAERDIAILTIKGMSIAEIAEARGKSVGTIKAQNSSIYRKSGLSGRVQFISYFLELLSEGL